MFTFANKYKCYTEMLFNSIEFLIYLPVVFLLVCIQTFTLAESVCSNSKLCFLRLVGLAFPVTHCLNDLLQLYEWHTFGPQ